MNIFGYLVCNKKGLSEEETARYQEMYCGVCKSIGKQFGQIERMSLSYEMTFLALFLSALYEEKEESYAFRCPFHPTKKKQAVNSEIIDYAASMGIILTYYKCLDDWEDERNGVGLAYSKILKEKYLELEKKYPRQCQAIARSVKELSEIEKSVISTADQAVNASGRMLAELFVYKEDFWCNSLRSFGYELGRFIYMMDAAIDYQKDKKKKNYNPLFKMNKQPEEVDEMLTVMIGKAAAEFEKLPIVDDANLIRNILYGGVWMQYNAKIKGEKKDDNRSV